MADPLDGQNCRSMSSIIVANCLLILMMPSISIETAVTRNCVLLTIENNAITSSLTGVNSRDGRLLPFTSFAILSEPQVA